jgi:superfamily II DNA helicase RecQ
MENHKQRRIIRMEICRCIGVDRASSFVFVHEVVEAMNSMANDVQKNGEVTETGIIFSGTRQEYEAIGNSLLDKLYELEPHVNAARQRLIQMAGE